MFQFAARWKNVKSDHERRPKRVDKLKHMALRSINGLLQSSTHMHL